jgi:hypothetical protein
MVDVVDTMGRQGNMITAITTSIIIITIGTTITIGTIADRYWSNRDGLQRGRYGRRVPGIFESPSRFSTWLTRWFCDLPHQRLSLKYLFPQMRKR